MCFHFMSCVRQTQVGLGVLLLFLFNSPIYVQVVFSDAVSDDKVFMIWMLAPKIDSLQLLIVVL